MHRSRSHRPAQMVSGALYRSPADLAIAVTSVLDPEPDEDGNPVGLVFLAYARGGMDPDILRRDSGLKPHDVLHHTVVLDTLALLARHVGAHQLKAERRACLGGIRLS